MEWSYRHEYIRASRILQEEGGLFKKGEKKVTTYPSTEIADKLDTLGEEGWELISMEPHWYWERKGVSAAMEVAYPLAIIGWYCTFRKPVGSSA